MKRMDFLRCNCDVHVTRDKRLGEMERRRASNTAVVAALRNDLRRVQAGLDATRDELTRSRGELIQLDASFRPVQDLALLHPPLP